MDETLIALARQLRDTPGAFRWEVHLFLTNHGELDLAHPVTAALLRGKVWLGALLAVRL